MENKELKERFIEDALAFAKKHINLTYLINAEVMREQGNATPFQKFHK